MNRGRGQCVLTRILVLGILAAVLAVCTGCQFYPIGEYLRFVRIPENVPVGGEILRIELHPRRNLSLQPVDRAEDAQYFTVRDIDDKTVAVMLAQSLDELVDNAKPQNVLKFRLVCNYDDGEDMIASYLSVTVYVEDINDHSPQFLRTPYEVTVDELTPIGLTLFRGIQAHDKDKPNTPNSDVQYSIVDGNDKGKFSLESSQKTSLVLRKPLDFDAGDHSFRLTIMASDRGSPPRNTTSSVVVTVVDNDDLNPTFTEDVYRTQITEFYPLTGKKIHKELKFTPPISAYDEDIGIDTALHYDIVAGNERGMFAVDRHNGTLFLDTEIDLDNESNLPGNTFNLQIQASQSDNPLKTAVARVEVEVLDLNDNMPKFEVAAYNISIVENLPNGFSVLQVYATDKDQGDNGEFTYKLDDPSRAFSMDPRTGWLTVRDQVKLDREVQPALTMKVFAKEKSPSVTEGTEASVLVEVTLLDANDNNPTFIPSNLYEFAVHSDAKVGEIIGQVKAVDPDLGRNGMILYSMQRSSGNATAGAALPFAVDAQTGQVVVIDSPLEDGRHALFVEASDQPANPSERRFTLAVVTIEVLRSGATIDKSDVVPEFIGAPYEFWVGANVGIGTSVGQVRVTDAVDRYRVIYDLLHSYKDGVPFAVEERSGTITVVDDIAKFEQTLYSFEAVVTDGIDSNLVTNVTIHVVDPDSDKGPGRGTVEFRVRENLSGALVGQLGHEGNGTSADPGRWKSIKFTIANQQDVVDKFAVSQDGTIYTQKGLDREEQDLYRITVVTENARGSSKGAGVYQVNVLVEDENDNAPVFDHQSYEGHIEENSAGGAEVSLDHVIHATDADAGTNSQFSFTLHGDGSELFAVDQATGKVFVKTKSNKILDREEKSTYTLQVVARDKGNLKSEVKLTIHVDDVNDNAPSFLQMVVLHDRDVEVSVDSEVINITSSSPNIDRYAPPLVTLPENTAIGTQILRLLATDKDAGFNAMVAYKIASEAIQMKTKTSNQYPKNYFFINANSGDISVVKTLPAETEFRLNVTVVDGGELTDAVTVRIYVKDINDHAPIFKKSVYNFDLPEGTYSDLVMGRVEATDDDYGMNANITYSLLTIGNHVSSGVPFSISEYDGVLTVSGVIDREEQNAYIFRAIAMDHGSTNQHRTTVDIHVHVLDVNDNAPSFFGYDRIMQISVRDQDFDAHGGESPVEIPVYYSTVAENIPIGTIINKIYANDSDFAGNGNGLIIYDISREHGIEDLFAVDSKEGFVTTVGKLDYETKSVHNVTIVASDVGNPSLSSTAILVVNVIDVAEEVADMDRPVFAHRYYEVEVEENVDVPMKILVLNVTDTYRGQHLRFSIVPDEDTDMFKVDPRNGTVYLMYSPDREEKAVYEFKVMVEKMKKSRGFSTLIYPLSAEKLVDIASNEVKVIVRIKDVNDNAPLFTINGRPIIAAIPTSANFGYQIVRLQAIDLDEGENKDIRYQILGATDEESRKFAVDAMTGQVRSIVNFAREAGRVYGFDVKATDRKGADDGKSSIANVFVYVLDENKQLVMIVDAKPMFVERNMANITAALQDVTGFDVRVRKIEPHMENDLEKGGTDLYLYAVDPHMNVIIDMDTFQHVMTSKESDVKRRLDAFNVLGIANDIAAKTKPRTQRYLLSSLEVGVVVLGCIVFIGALAAAVCVGCVRRGRNRSKHPKMSDYQSQLGFTIAPPSKSTLYPYIEHYPGDTTDTYVDMQSNQSSQYPRHHHQHDANCTRHHQRRRPSSAKQRPGGGGGVETSSASLQSSGKDSGIADAAARCTCGNSTSHSSGNSSNGSFEDSLKSLQQKNGMNVSNAHVRRGNLPPSRRRPRQHNMSDDCVQQIPVHVVAAAANAKARRPSQRLMMDALL